MTKKELIKILEPISDDTEINISFKDEEFTDDVVWYDIDSIEPDSENKHSLLYLKYPAVMC